jgi:hypothetical protein
MTNRYFDFYDVGTYDGETERQIMCVITTQLMLMVK